MKNKRKNKLLPCPFCGKRATIVKEDYYDDKGNITDLYKVGCSSRVHGKMCCGNKNRLDPDYMYPTQISAEVAWNFRDGEDKLP